MMRTSSPSLSTTLDWMPSSVALLNLQNTQAPVSLTMILLPSISISWQSPPSRCRFGRMSSITALMMRVRSSSCDGNGFETSDSTSMAQASFHNRLDQSMTTALDHGTQANDLPQPQLAFALGFSKVKPDPSSATTKSIVVPARYSWLFMSTNTRTPSRSITVSSGSMA